MCRARHFFDTLADMLTEVEANTISDRVGNVNVDTLVHTHDNSLAELKAKALGDTLAETIAELQAKTLSETHC